MTFVGYPSVVRDTQPGLHAADEGAGTGKCPLPAAVGHFQRVFFSAQVFGLEPACCLFPVALVAPSG